MPHGGGGDCDHVGGGVQALEGGDLEGEGDAHGGILPSFMRESGWVDIIGRVRSKIMRSILSMGVLNLRGWGCPLLTFKDILWIRGLLLKLPMRCLYDSKDKFIVLVDKNYYFISKLRTVAIVVS